MEPDAIQQTALVWDVALVYVPLGFAFGLAVLGITLGCMVPIKWVLDFGKLASE